MGKIVWIALLLYGMGMGTALSQALSQALWQTVAGGADHFVTMLWPEEGRLYVSGPFDTIGGIGAAGFAYYDGDAWNQLGIGTGHDPFGQPGEALSLLTYKGELLATGYFGAIPNGEARTVHCAKWDGENWISLGEVDASSYLQVANDELMVVGRFDTIGGREINHVGRWDGNAFVPLSEEVPFEAGDSRNVLCVGHYQGQYYIGGNLRLGSGMDAVIRWDGQQWVALGAGLHGPFIWVRRMVEYKGILFVGGYFWKSGINPSSYIAAWDGEQWFDPFPGVTFLDQPGTMKVIGDRLYILGPHVQNANPEMYQMAYYNGNYFCSFGNQEEQVGDVCMWGGELYASGNYLAYHAVPYVRYIGKWLGGTSTDVCQFSPLPTEYLVSGGDNAVLYPNPPDQYFSLQLPDSATHSEIAVYDAAGREVIGLRSWDLGDEPVDVSHFAAGVYVVRVWVNGKVQNVKLVVN